MKTDKAAFAGAIYALQRRLGETQEGMARKLGCTLGAYSKWVRGERTPGGMWLMKLLELCPDHKMRALFSGSPTVPRQHPPMAPADPRVQTQVFEELMQVFEASQQTLLRREGTTMNRQQVKAFMKDVEGALREKWTQLTDLLVG